MRKWNKVRQRNEVLCCLFRLLYGAGSGCAAESGSEAVNLIMSHWARLKAKLIDQMLGERARKSQSRAADRPAFPLFLSFQLLFHVSPSTKMR